MQRIRISQRASRSQPGQDALATSLTVSQIALPNRATPIETLIILSHTDCWTDLGPVVSLRS